jgi:hypothetical protein
MYVGNCIMSITTEEFNIHRLNVFSILIYLRSDYCVDNSDLYSEMYNIRGIKDRHKSIVWLTILIKTYCLDKKLHYFKMWVEIWNKLFQKIIISGALILY